MKKLLLILLLSVTCFGQSKIDFATRTRGIVSVNRGGTGTTTPSLIPGTNISITGAWPNQTINANGISGSPTLGTQVVGNGSAFAVQAKSVIDVRDYAGATADLKILAACAALPTNGGTIDLRGFGSTTQTIANQVLCSTATKQVTFLVDNSTHFNITESDGNCTFPFDNGSGVFGISGQGANNFGGFYLTSSSNVQAIFCPAHAGFGQQDMFIDRIYISGASGATVGKGLVYIYQLGGTNTFITNSNLTACNTSCIWLEDTTDIFLSNNNLNGQGGDSTITGSGLVIKASGVGGVGMSHVTVVGGDIQHAGGTTGVSDVLITGDDAGALVSDIDLIGVYIERTNQTPAPLVGIKIRDCWNCHIGPLFGGGTPLGTTFIQISQSSAGRSINNVIENVHTGGTYTNLVDDQVDGVTYSSASYPMISRLVTGGGTEVILSPLLLNINGSNTFSGPILGSFTGLGTGIAQLQGPAGGAGSLYSLDFTPGSGMSFPVLGRIALKTGLLGSHLIFGTSNNGSLGVTNTALDIDYNGAATFVAGATFGGPTAVSNGNVSNPSQTFSGDLTSGFYLVAPGSYGLVGSGVEAMRVNGGGNPILSLRSTTSFTWASGALGTTGFDTNLSRTSAGFLAIGTTATVGDFTGGLQLSALKLTNLIISATAPTISSGFGTSPSIATNNGTAAFTINVGAGGIATTGIIGMPTATTGWICNVHNLTAKAANSASDTVQIASSTTTVSVQNQTVSTGAAVAWTASDIVTLACVAY